MLAVVTIAAGLFVLGVFLLLNANLQRLVGRWTQSAELSVYLKDDVSADQLRIVDELVGGSGLAAHREYVSKTQAAARFRQDFPDIAGPAERLDTNPFPASIEVRLHPDARHAGTALDNLAAALAAIGGVADVRYDRRWLARLHGVVTALRAIGL
nr:permease-like cell division protein FtsX [Acidobacteriota bacterium]